MSRFHVICSEIWTAAAPDIKPFYEYYVYLQKKIKTERERDGERGERERERERESILDSFNVEYFDSHSECLFIG